MNSDMKHLDPAFDPRIADWFEADPDHAPQEVLDTVMAALPSIPQRRALRVPWRFPRMSLPARAVALIALGLLVIAGAVAFSGIGGRSAIPSVQPSAATVPTAVSTATLPAMDATFTSPWHGYRVTYPSAWTVTPATRAWPPRTQMLWGDTALDEIKGSSASSAASADVRFVGTQQKYAPGQTPADWLQKYCAAALGSCAPSALPTTKVGGNTAYITLNGVSATGETIVPDGQIFDVVVPLTERAYDFTLDGHVDRATLEFFLTGIRLMPSDAVDTPPLTDRFSSPTNGFSVGILPEWRTSLSTATKHWHGVGNPNEVFDGFSITGTDTNFGGASQPLGSQTFDEFLVAYHNDSKPNVPDGCDGGEPSTWPELQIGDKVGRLQMLCNAADAFVEAGGRVYIFELGNETFDPADDFGTAAWKMLLTSVKLEPATAKD